MADLEDPSSSSWASSSSESPSATSPVVASEGKRVAGKVALVTGGAGAIGRTIAETLAAHGAKVWIADFNTVKGLETVEQIRKELKTTDVEFSNVDVTKEEDVSAWCAAVVEKWGKIDILVNNAAAFVFGTIEEANASDWDKVLNVNVKGYANCAKFAVQQMKKNGGGSIVHVASISAHLAQPSFTPYNTSKGALLQLSRCIACDYGEYHIRSNSICPGTIDTPATSAHAAKLNLSKAELTDMIVRDHFIKRLGHTQDVANAVLFFASDESSFITGADLTVDGGYCAH